jgi:hypothetical protein
VIITRTSTLINKNSNKNDGDDNENKYHNYLSFSYLIYNVRCFMSCIIYNTMSVRQCKMFFFMSYI